MSGSLMASVYNTTWVNPSSVSFIAVGGYETSGNQSTTGGVILTSPQGTDWYSRSSGSSLLNVSFADVAKSTSTYLTGSFFPQAINNSDWDPRVSSDGLTWSSASGSSMPANTSMQSIVWNGTNFVAVNKTRVSSPTSTGSIQVIPPNGTSAWSTFLSGSFYDSSLTTAATGSVYSTKLFYNGTSYLIIGMATASVQRMSTDFTSFTTVTGQTDKSTSYLYTAGPSNACINSSNEYVLVGGIYNQVGVGQSIMSVDSSATTLTQYMTRIEGIAASSTTYVYVGGTTTMGMIQTTTDFMFIKRVDNGSYAPLKSVAYGAGVFVAVGDNNTVLRSTDDGTTWSTESIAAGVNFVSCIYANSLFVVSGSNGVVYSSADGVSWTAHSTGYSATHYVAWNGSVWLSAGSTANSIRTSPDLTTWTLQSTAQTTSFVPKLAAGGEGAFIVGNSPGGNGIYSLDNGSTWVSKSFGSGSSQPPGCLFYGNGYFVIGSSRNTGLSYADVVSGAWTNFVPTGRVNRPNTAGAYINGKWLLAGNVLQTTNGAGPQCGIGQIDYSTTAGAPNGGTWVNATPPFTAIAWDAARSQYIIVGNNGYVAKFTFETGIYQLENIPTSVVLSSVACKNGTCVAVGLNGVLISSTDLINWTLESTGTTCDLINVRAF